MWSEILKGKMKPDMLVMGSSRAWRMYSPMVLDSITGLDTYNLGIDGSSCDRQIARWYLYDSYNTKPKVIVQNLDYLTSMNRTNGYEREQFFPYFWNKCFRSTVFKFESFTFPEKYIPMYRYVKFGLPNILQKEQISLKNGYCSCDKTWDSKSFERSSSNHVFSYDGAIEDLFRDYVSSVQHEGIKMFFVLAPMYSGMREKCNEFDKMYDTYNKLSSDYSIPILDYTFCDISYDTTFFYNGTHLNSKGAVLFSTRLAHDLDSLLSVL